MGVRSTIKGYWRAHGATMSSSSSSSGPSPGVLPITLAVTVDAADAAGTVTGKVLPAGATVLAVHVVSGHSGGTAPLLDLGVVGTDDGFLNGVVADASVSADLAAGSVLPAADSPERVSEISTTKPKVVIATTLSKTPKITKSAAFKERSVCPAVSGVRTIPCIVKS